MKLEIRYASEKGRMTKQISDPVVVDKICGNAIRVNGSDWWKLKEDVKCDGRTIQVPTLSDQDHALTWAPESNVKLSVRKSTRARQIPLKFRN